MRVMGAANANAVVHCLQSRLCACCEMLILLVSGDSGQRYHKTQRGKTVASLRQQDELI